ncbi:hypothetical protein [Saccharomonospora iraqiensis]|uniref:hypothetical protein n=1 Tax=Saccharomonospora iraqiensis TaxID=52698 RepID=UPI00022DF500|nr:hypothetical protein [Saccharomonospora iraqiensis]
MFGRQWIGGLLVVVLGAATVSCSGVEGTGNETGDAVRDSATGAPRDTGAASRDTDQQVVAMFDRYRRALEQGDGATAVELISDETVDYYRTLAELGATAGPERLGELPALDRYNVAVFRTISTPAELNGMSGREAYVLGVEEGMVNSAAIARHDIGEVTVRGDEATATVLRDGEKGPFEYEFARSGDSWTINMMPMVGRARSAFAMMAEQQGMSEDELIFRSVETTTGTRPDESIFDRP